MPKKVKPKIRLTHPGSDFKILLIPSAIKVRAKRLGKIKARYKNSGLWGAIALLFVWLCQKIASLFVWLGQKIASGLSHALFFNYPFLAKILQLAQNRILRNHRKKFRKGFILQKPHRLEIF